MTERRLTVLIVDDEFRIGKLIQKLIDWQGLNLECQNVLQDGESALRELTQCPADIVITDIRMPKINGLDLIRTLKEQGCRSCFIVISGYREFEYARQALQYGVENYILKPVNEEDLNNTLRRVREKLLAEDDRMERQQQAQKTADAGTRIIKSDFLRSLIRQADIPPDEHGIVRFTGEKFRGIDIKLDYTNGNQIGGKQDGMTAEYIRATVEKIFEPETEEILTCEQEDLHLFCLFNYRAGQSREVRDAINEVLSRIKAYLIGFDQYEATVGVGGEKGDLAGIHGSLEEARRAVCNRMKYGTGRLIYYENMATGDGREILRRVDAAREQLCAAIDVYNLPEVSRLIGAVFEETGSEETDMTAYYEAAEKRADCFYGYLSEKMDGTDASKSRLLHRMQHCNRLSSLAALFKNEFGGCLNAIRSAIESQSVKPIRQAKQYVDEHYPEKILLEDVAEVVGLNAVYFSALFKKETGMNFSNYLLKVRMEHAKKMLIETNDTILAVASSVGYGDPKYFSQLFQKAVGVKPALYRRMHS